MDITEQQFERMFKVGNVSQYSELARLIGETQSTLGSWKKRGIPDGKLYKAAEILNCRSDWLRKGEGPMRDQPPDVGHSYTAESSLNAEEQTLLNNYRVADPAIKKAAQRILEDSAIESRRNVGGGSDLQAEKSA